jgi:uncharacterized membrane protein
MTMEQLTAKVMKTSVIVSIILIVMGLILDLTGITQTVLYIGIALLIVCPLFGVIVTTGCLIRKKEKQWIAIAFVLILISIINMTISVMMMK